MIVRSKRKSGYTVMSNKGLTDERLSWKARGLLAYLLSKPDDWSISERQLADAGPDGRAAVQSALAELEGHSYVKREKTRNEKGHIIWVSTIADEPWIDFPTTDNPSAGKPSAGSPSADEPSAGNQTIISTVVTSTDPTNTEQQPVADATADVPPALSLAEQFRILHDELKNAKNRAQVLRRAYVACHGEIDAPTHGRLGAFAGRIGSWGQALDAIWTCTARPPNGDILSYLEKAKPSRGREVGDEDRGSYQVEQYEPEEPRVTTANLGSTMGAAPAPPSMASIRNDPWALTLHELGQANAGADWLVALAGSRLEDSGTRMFGGKAKPFYRVHVTVACDIAWLTKRSEEQLHFKLGSILGKPVLIEIVAAEPAQACGNPLGAYGTGYGEERP